MRLLVILIVAVVAALLETTLGAGPMAPRLMLALLAWLAMVYAPSPRVYVYAWLVGLIRDAADPGSTYYYGLFALVAVVVGQALRRRVYPGAATSVALAAALLALVDSGIKWLLINPGGLVLLEVLARMLSTALLALVLALALRPLAPRLKVEHDSLR